MSAAIGAGFFGIVAFVASWQSSLLAGFDAAALTFIASVWLAIHHLDGTATRETAQREDPSAPVVGTTVIVGCVLALVAEVLGLVKAERLSGLPKTALIVLAVLAAVSGWIAVHTVYTLHYARLFFDEGAGGIDFNIDDLPDFYDFAYFAFTVGMTYQVSDTNITDRQIRRAVTRHALVSFLFGTVIIGTTINVMAGLIGR
jgi:uncharacterized membrane protein